MVQHCTGASCGYLGPGDIILLLSFFVIINDPAHMPCLTLPHRGAQAYTKAPFRRMKGCLLNLLLASSARWSRLSQSWLFTSWIAQSCHPGLISGGRSVLP